jgi:mRNA interferase MazF
MKQRDIYLTRFDRAKGSEQKGIRPAVIISGDSLNDKLDVCIICPLSLKIKPYPGTIVIKKNKFNGLTEDSQLMTFQVRVVSKTRFIKKIGEISVSELTKAKSLLFEVLTY